MKHLLFEQRGTVGILTVNRPESLNALNHDVLHEMASFLEGKRDLRGLILTGAGEKAFIAGADIKEMLPMDAAAMMQFCSLGQKVSNLLENAPFVTLASVNGFALGGGLEMALACDFIYASTSAKLGLPEVTLGLIPGFGGTQRLTRAVGTRQAKEIIMSGKPLKAAEAQEVGIVNRVCAPDTLHAESLSCLEGIAQNSFYAVMQAKQAINVGQSLAMTESLELEKQMCAVCCTCPDRAEGMSAFIEKRKPQFV